MPRQNRVTPFGKIIATPERGTLMGNRGLLHDGDGQIRRDWRLKRWIHCVLEFKGRHRQVMTPGVIPSCSSWTKPPLWPQGTAHVPNVCAAGTTISARRGSPVTRG